MSRPRVEILIDELVLDGFRPGDRQRIAEAFSRELQQLVAAGDAGALAQIGDRPLLRAGEVPLAPGARAEVVGSQLARTLHTSLTAKGSRDELR
ncbi:MAG: hypothetical protein JXB85_00260 [Anaerolineales bacterium]|nr:hypothetical protein [Anaerolineales bacterium]